MHKVTSQLHSLSTPCKGRTSCIVELWCLQNVAKISGNIRMHCIIDQYCQASHRHLSSTLASTKSSSLLLFFLGNIRNPLVRTLISFNQSLVLRFKNQDFNWILKYKYLISCTFFQCIFLPLCKFCFTIYQKRYT